MILFIALVIVILIAVILIAAVTTVGGSAFVIMFGDILVCIWIIYRIIRRIIAKKNK